MADIYLTITGMAVEDRQELSSKVVEALDHKVRGTGGGTSLGEVPESDLDFATDLNDPVEVMSLAFDLCKTVTRLTEGKAEIRRVAVCPERS